MFQRLTPIKYLYNKNWRSYWLFKCECGNEVIRKLNAYKTGNTKSCGCLITNPPMNKRAKNEIGKTFNRLTATKRLKKRNKKGISLIYYECNCICGNTVIVLGSRLRNNNTKSCGCHNIDQIIKRNQDPEIISKRANSLNKKYKIIHWKTKKELYATGSWELGVLKYLNNKLIDYDWQIKFPLIKRVFICDLYLKDFNIYIEIKGRWLKDAKRKFNLFKKLYPELNIDIWNRKKLIKMGIINNQGVLK